MNAILVNTPCDVLLNGNQRLGPQLSALHCGAQYEVIYGFSGKQPYDLFCANCDLPLAPYPLVKGYLKNQIAASNEAIHLIVVDAAGPQQAHLNAATMNSVLQAREENANQVTVSFHLTLDETTQSYRVEAAASSAVQTSRPPATPRT